MEVDSIQALMAQLSAMSKKLEKLEASTVSTQVTCGLCGGPHENHNCSSIQDDQSSDAQVNHMGNNQPSPPLQPNVPQKPSQLEVSLQKLSQSTSAFVDSTQNFMQETRANFKNQEASIRNLEVQVGQITKQLNERPPNTFPSDTIPNLREECKAVTLQIGKTIGNDSKDK
ncbi:hypothetical protein PIB30_099675 [Stylosanthes scabra]|uniref:Uncharacterized protein n=1 Tax=Stylosanthes scabra TaxID=79078 RepID=A0ABU6SX96_9FABA|nr:hypothetical protein [Stylosanthes scabra]